MKQVFAVALVALAPLAAQAQSKDMTFFVTSSNPGKGADYGGLKGADAYCQKLATAAGAGRHTWRAYLSTQGADAVNARDRIGKGPWKNARGEVIAMNVDELHGAGNRLGKQTSLNEKGEELKGAGEKPNVHDILTGSQPDGRAFPADKGDMTCGNWTKSGADGTAMLGHMDRKGLREDDASHSWNSSHPSRGGCSLEALKSTGGDGRLYCFAAE